MYKVSEIKLCVRLVDYLVENGMSLEKAIEEVSKSRGIDNNVLVLIYQNKETL